MNPNVKKIAAWGAAIGISGGVVVTILVFALNAYVSGVVKTNVAKELALVPTTLSIDAKLTTIQDGITDNATAIGAVATSQQNFELLFIDYLRKQNEVD